MKGIESLLAPPVIALAAFLAACATTPPATAPGVRAELAPTGTLRVAVFTGNPVLGSRDRASGEVTGTTVTMGRALAARADVPARIIEYTAIAKLVEDAKTGEWDIAVVAFDPARRTLKRVSMEDGVLAARLVKELMEDENAEARRVFLAEHSRKIKELDV